MTARPELCFFCSSTSAPLVEVWGELVCVICATKWNQMGDGATRGGSAPRVITVDELSAAHNDAVERARSDSEGYASWAFEMGRAAAFYGLFPGADADAATETDRRAMRRYDAARKAASR